jgi:pyrroloquinoline quinone (PQQ) biosynthesis protein C
MGKALRNGRLLILHNSPNRSANLRKWPSAEQPIIWDFQPPTGEAHPYTRNPVATIAAICRIRLQSKVDLFQGYLFTTPGQHLSLDSDLPATGSEMDIQQAHDILETTRVCDHPFLRSMNSRTMSDDQVRRFGIQWYKAAAAHKKAFPGLIYNTTNDVVRFDLIHILRDEYGNGDVNSIHGFMLLRFLKSLGYSEADIASYSTIPEVQEFSRLVDDIWLNDHPVRAFGVHYALEVLAAEMHQTFGRGLRTAEKSSTFNMEYFDYHGIAEIEHADISDRGLLIYDEQPQNRDLLTDGLKQGKDLICLLWDGLDKHVFGNEIASRQPAGRAAYASTH